MANCNQHQQESLYTCQECKTVVCSKCLDTLCGSCQLEYGSQSEHQNELKCPSCLDQIFKRIQHAVGKCSQCNCGHCLRHTIRIPGFLEVKFCSNYCAAEHLKQLIYRYQELLTTYENFSRLDSENWKIKK